MRSSTFVAASLLLVLAVVVSSPAQGALSTTLINSEFNRTSELQPFDRTVDGWLEHEDYLGPGPLGNGAGVNPPVFGVEGTDGDQLMLILGGDAGTWGQNSATVMQSIGMVEASDLGKVYTFSAGAVAFDWFGPPVTPFSGDITLSFREGASPDDGNYDNFNYGSLLGTEGTLTTAVGAITDGDGIQNGIGDEGGLKEITATFAPTSGDLGKEVFVVINLAHGSRAPEGESRFLVDNAMITVMDAPPGVPGDYNEDMIVNLADYTIWRDNLGTNLALPNEVAGISPGSVTVEDYDAWKVRFGNTSGSASLAFGVHAVPEPSSFILLAVGILTLRRSTNVKRSRRDCTQ